MTDINQVRLPFVPIGGVDTLNRPSIKISEPKKTAFDEVLAGEISNLKFSGHAKSRLISRDIIVSESDILRLEEAVEQAAGKGANESLVLLDNKAFIVSIKNRTVITLLNREHMEDNVITKIDSAVFA